ncbi:MAG: sterol carrier protein [Promethearchaeota archaeon]|nr:MAG: sterol carrier protein [Candidatus Lokiarchaeota archaeon]
MPKFGSNDWAKAFCKAINDNTAYKESASWWEGDFVFVIQPSGNLKEEIKMYVGLLHGDCTGAKTLAPGEAFDTLPANSPPRPLKEGEKVGAEFVFSGTYDNWVKVLKKELDPIQGLMAGKFKLVGNMAKVMRATKAAQELVASTTRIDTEFY